MMSICFTWFHINGLVEPNLYHNLGEFTRMCGFYLEGVWLWRISGGYSQRMMELILKLFNWI